VILINNIEMNILHIPINRYPEVVIRSIIPGFYAKLDSIKLSKAILRLPEVMDPFDITFKEYMAIDEKRVSDLQIRTLREKEKWIEENIRERGAGWIVVCGGEVVKWSRFMEKYPAKDELKKIGKKYNKILFVFSAAPLIEECEWSRISPDDHYLRIEFSVTGKNELIPVKGDLDTGAPNIFLDLDNLMSGGIINLNRFEYPNRGIHLGKNYIYYVKRVTICINDEKGKTNSLEFNSYCVSNWQKSPFCAINPDREALVGRCVLFKFKLKIELDGKEKVTKVYL